MDFRIFENDQYVSITQEWNAWQGDTVCEAAVRGHLLLIAHLKARTEDVGNSGPLACHISTSAQDTILFIWFAFRLCPLTSGYSKLEDTSQPRQSLSSVKSKSFIWAQLGWRKKKKNSSCARHAPFALHLHLSYVETRQPSLNDPLFRGCCLFQCLFQFAMLTGGKSQNHQPTLTPKPENKRLLFYRKRRQVG